MFWRCVCDVVAMGGEMLAMFGKKRAWSAVGGAVGVGGAGVASCVGDLIVIFCRDVSSILAIVYILAMSWLCAGDLFVMVRDTLVVVWRCIGSPSVWPQTMENILNFENSKNAPKSVFAISLKMKNSIFEILASNEHLDFWDFRKMFLHVFCVRVLFKRFYVH
jgi:hypothetical protein